MAAIPAGQVGGGTALAETVIGVATELPLAGAVMVMIPFEVEANMGEASNIVRTKDFIVILLSLVFAFRRQYIEHVAMVDKSPSLTLASGFWLWN